AAPGRAPPATPDRHARHPPRDPPPGAVDHAREDVTPELVGPEPVLGPRLRALLDEALARRIVRRQPRRQRRAQHEQDDQRQADHREPVAEKPSPGGHPWRPMRGSRTPYERSTRRLIPTNASAKTSTAPCSRM